MASFLNSIVDECVALLGGTKVVGVVPRRWTADYSTITLSGHDAKRKPDLVLLDDERVADWRCVRSIGEMKSGATGTVKGDMFQQLAGECWHNYTGGCPAESYLAGKTSIIFALQDNHEFVLSVGFQRGMMFHYRIDRGGSISSLSVTGQHDNPEYSDSEDEKWMNPPPRPASPPASRTAERVSEHIRNRAPATPARSPSPPTPMDSQVSDATTIDDSKIELDKLYKITNPWFNEGAPNHLLNRTVSI